MTTGCGGGSAPAPSATAPSATSSTTTNPTTPTDTLSSTVTTTTDKAEEITSGEFYEFCKAAEADAAKGDGAALNSRFNMDLILETAMNGIDIPAQAKADFTTGFKSGLQRAGLGQQIVAELQQGGMWKLLRVHKQKGRRLAWFRMKGPAGLNYHHLILNKNSAGEIKVSDLYIMAAGEMLSSTLRRGILPVAASANRSMLSKLVTSESEYVKSFKQIVAFQNAVKEGQHQQALVLYAALPESVQQDKTMLMLRLKAASLAQDWENYRQAIESLKKAYPNEPNADLLGIDTYCLQKDFDGALKCIDRVEQSVGGDPYLDELRASVQMQNEKIPEAKALAAKAIRLDPPSLDAYWVLVTISLTEKNHPETLALLKSIKQTFVMEFADMNTLPEYADFVKSPEYQMWLKVMKP